MLAYFRIVVNHLNMPRPDDLLTTTAVCLILDCTTRTVCDWCDAEMLPCQRTAGGHRRLILSDVLKFAQDRGLPVNLRKLSEVNKRVRPLKKR